MLSKSFIKYFPYSDLWPQMLHSDLRDGGPDISGQLGSLSLRLQTAQDQIRLQIPGGLINIISTSSIWSIVMKSTILWLNKYVVIVLHRINDPCYLHKLRQATVVAKTTTVLCTRPPPSPPSTQTVPQITPTSGRYFVNFVTLIQESFLWKRMILCFIKMWLK